MSGPFRPDELDGAEGMTPDELAAEARLARELEAVAGRVPVATSPGFADRVMAAVGAEPLPAPARAAGHALRTAALIALLASIRDAFRVTFSGGFPAVVRVQALAVVLVVVALGGGVTYGAAAALGLVDGGPTPPVEVPTATDDPSEAPEATAPPSPSPSPSESAEWSPSPSPSESAEPGETPEPTETPDDEDKTDDSGGSASGDNKTASPTRKPTPKPTPKPTATPDEDDEHATDTPQPTRTPRPSDTPDPEATPTPDNDAVTR